MLIALRLRVWLQELNRPWKKVAAYEWKMSVPSSRADKYKRARGRRGFVGNPSIRNSRRINLNDSVCWPRFESEFSSGFVKLLSCDSRDPTLETIISFFIRLSRAGKQIFKIRFISIVRCIFFSY